ncbi:MAG: HEAT repeat domain-containing protein [Desulfobacteraceae bacterium]|nr:HEAT repeat domain-containing protein [Desulfobacteraceae bacterium]
MTSFKWQNFTKFRRAMKEHSVKKLIKKLSARNRHTWDKVSGALINAGSLAVEPLTVVLKDKVNNTYYVRERVAFILGKIGYPRATESLIEAMGDISDNVCISATWALGKIGDKNAVEPLIDSLNNSNEVVRCSAANALGMIGDQISIQPLIRALKDSDGNVRSSAAEALGVIGDPCAVPHLIDAMRDDFLSYNKLPGQPKIPSAIVCGSAVEALGKTGGPDVKEHLVSALNDKYPNVRDSAARALGRRGDPDAVYVLIETLKTDDNEFVRKSAASIKSICCS